MKKMTFFARFVDDILAERKTITIRDTSEANLHAGDILDVSTLEEGRWFCRLKVLSITETKLADLSPLHAAQENMALPELKALIKEIYPEQELFYVIQFGLLTDITQ